MDATDEDRDRRTWTARLNSPLAAVLVTAVLVSLFVALRLVVNVDGVGGFVVAGERFTDANVTGLPVVADGGYDGQFVWALAQDPLTDDAVTAGVELDSPPYRQQRIALPATVWALHGLTGVSHALLLLLVNCAAVLGIAAIGAVLARRYGRHALWGVAIALSPGVLVSLARDLNEPLAALGLIGGLALWTTSRWGLAIAPFCLAALARETTLAVLVGLGVWALVELARSRDWRTHLPRAAALLVPLALVLAWQRHLAGVWDQVPLQANNGNLRSPFIGVIGHLFRGVGDVSPARDGVLQHLWIAERSLLLVALAFVVLRIRRSAVSPALRAGFLGGALLAMMSPRWSSDVQFWRVANEAVLTGLIVAVGLEGRARNVLLGGSLVMTAAVAVVHGVFV
jgi:hypothetical protein